MMPSRTPEKRREYNQKYYAANRAAIIKKVTADSKVPGFLENQRARYAARMANPDYKKKKQEKLREYKRKNFEKCKQLDIAWRNNNRQRYRATKRKWEAANAESLRERKNNSYPRHREKRLAAGKIHYRKNRQAYRVRDQKRRALLAMASADTRGILGYFNLITSHEFTQCYYCGNQIPTKGCHFDHIRPISRGGPHALGNLCPTCPTCNLSKGSKLLSEWEQPRNQLLML